eukprot:TRINITY_DN41634_c0_g1_i1.p2 TRINITY_DN41634_c0_g1~~TRINITY_DN41634_c0_g1_i1.p2  ORF type:complete len:121 (-),score=51.99 TRINITY_DN41634_c0_g1_i1:56-418(-)
MDPSFALPGPHDLLLHDIRIDPPPAAWDHQRVQQWAEEVSQLAHKLSEKDKRYRERADELVKIVDALSQDQEFAAAQLAKEKEKNRELVQLMEEMIEAKEKESVAQAQAMETMELSLIHI